MPESVKSIAGLRKKFDELPDGIQAMLGDQIKTLLNHAENLDLLIAFCFMKIEQAHHRALIGGVVKKLHCNSQLATKIISQQHMTRKKFLELFNATFGKPLDSATKFHHSKAVKVRDAIIHGKSTTPSEKRVAIAHCFAYMAALNNQVYDLAKFNPLKDMRGYKGRKAGLSKGQTKWILMGIGYSQKPDDS